jgi:hypothetical protein
MPANTIPEAQASVKRNRWINAEALQYLDYLPYRSGMHRLLALELGMFCNPQTLDIHPSQKTLAEKLMVKERQVRRLLADLEEDKIIHQFARGKEHGGRSTNGFIIVGLAEFLERHKTQALSSWERGKAVIQDQFAQNRQRGPVELVRTGHVRPINRQKEKIRGKSKRVVQQSPSADAIFSDSTVRDSTDLGGVKGIVSGMRKRSARSAAIPAPDPADAKPRTMQLAKTLSRLDEYVNGAGRGAMRFDLRLHDKCMELQVLCDEFGLPTVKAAITHWLRALMAGEGVHRPGRIATWEFFRPVTVAWIKAEKKVGSPVFPY